MEKRELAELERAALAFLGGIAGSGVHLTTDEWETLVSIVNRVFVASSEKSLDAR